MPDRSSGNGRLLITCPDQPGIVAAISDFLHQHGANIIHSAQHTNDPEGGRFFMRIVFSISSFPDKFYQVKEEFLPIAEHFGMEWSLEREDRKKSVAIFISKEDHCLTELLWRWRSGELPIHISCVISNHTTLKNVVESYEIPFYHIPIEKNAKPEAEDKILRTLEQYPIDFLVLARYMQILSPDFVAHYPAKIINIHHSFLPAFIGANPYRQAFERGVKLIGATAHYVTNDLDEGPIIEQDVLRVNHQYNANDLKVTGRNAEKIALARAVTWHAEDRVIVDDNKTIVFL